MTARGAGPASFSHGALMHENVYHSECKIKVTVRNFVENVSHHCTVIKVLYSKRLGIHPGSWVKSEES